mmetsp:Transcript_5946/g.5225  ORF Transcript_5946/g.5225 Transcript_5946/m.5225 type:complete len:116 (-) Transcript_5946:837-1184(-)
MRMLNSHSRLEFGDNKKDKLKLFGGQNLYQRLRNVADLPKANKEIPTEAIDRVREHLQDFPSLTIDHEQNTFLHYAAKSGHPRIVSCLIAAGHPLIPKNTAGNTPLHFAAQRGRT